jgi:hypothetical protein
VYTEKTEMIAEDCSIAHLVDQAHAQVRLVSTLFNRVSNSLTVLQRGEEETAEGGWRRSNTW